MAYRLKSEIMQERLDILSEGGFSAELECLSKEIEEAINANRSIHIVFGEKNRLWLESERLNRLAGIDDKTRSKEVNKFSVWLDPEEFKKVNELKKDAWNRLDDVVPPAGEWLAVEWQETNYDGQTEFHGTRAKYVWDAVKNLWWFEDDYGEALTEDATEILFKVW